MLITSYYRGTTDKVSGVTFDTEKHTFKTWSLEPDVWSQDGWKKNLASKYLRKPEQVIMSKFRLSTGIQHTANYRRKHLHIIHSTDHETIRFRGLFIRV